MRYKALPASVRASAPAPTPEPPAPRRRSAARDWIATLPILLLVPVLVLPLIGVSAAPKPVITVKGAAAPGATVTVDGRNLPGRQLVTIVWDGAATDETIEIGRNGKLREPFTIPAGAAAGKHVLAVATADAETGEAGDPIASTDVVVATSPPPTPTPTPAPTAAPTPPPTPAPTPTPTPAPTAPPVTPAPTLAPTAAPGTPSPTVTPVATATPAPTPTPEPTRTAAPTRSPVPTPTPTATPTPTPVPTATAAPSPTAPAAPTGASSGGYIVMPREQLMALPTSGAAWDALVAAAWQSAPSPNLSDQDDPDNVTILAKALVYARTGNTAYRDAVLIALRSIPGTEDGGRTLALGRELAAYVLAADLVGYRDAAFVSWLRAVRTESLDGRTLVSTHEDRPNNWGTHAGATRVAIALYLGDAGELARAASVFRGYLGDRAAYAGFDYGDTTWQCDPSRPVGINPACTRNGVNLDGIMPDDMRRGGTFPTVGEAGVSYTWEGLQGALLQAHLLKRAGYDAWSWSDRALLRAVRRIVALGHPAEGDDLWQPWLLDAAYGTAYRSGAARSGKNFGYTDWLFAR